MPTTKKRRSRNAAGRHQAGRAAAKAKQAAAGAAAEKNGSAVGNYLGSDIDKAKVASTFDKEKSQKERVAANQAVKDQKAAVASGQRVSGRSASRNRDLQRVHGRTDEEKIASKASGDRNARLLKDAALAVAPGGAAGAVAAKVGYAKKAVGAVKTGLKVASKLGKGAVKQGAKKAAGALVNRVQKAGVKGAGKYLAKNAVKFGKYKAKVTAKGKANEAAKNV